MSDEEHEEDDEDEEDWNALAPSRPLVMPKFVAKERRETLTEKEREEEEERKKFEMEEKLALEVRPPSFKIPSLPL
jgi:hypothetical protein